MLEKKKSLLLVTEARLRMRRLSLILGSLVEPLCPSEQPQQRHSPGNIRHGRVLGAGKESSHSSGRPCQHLLRFGRCCPRETGSRPVQCGIPGPLLLCMAGPVSLISCLSWFFITIHRIKEFAIGRRESHAMLLVSPNRFLVRVPQLR